MLLKVIKNHFFIFSYLQYNRIQNLPSGAFYNLPELKILRLDQNPLNCSCRMAWIIDMVDKNSLQVSADCLFPVAMFGKPIKGLTPEDLHCGKNMLCKKLFEADLRFEKNFSNLNQ